MMLIQKIHCIAVKVNKLELKPRACPFLRTVLICRHKTVSKWHYLKELMSGIAWLG